MRIGLSLTSEWSAGENLEPKLEQMMEQVRVARDSGFASVWVVQHFLSGPNHQFQAMPLLGRLTAETQHMTLGTSILLLPMLSPVLLAEEVAALDWFTGGRFALGVGMGYRDHEFHAFGQKRSQRVSRFVEYIEVIRKLWTGEPVHHDGKWVKLEGQQCGLVPRQPGGVPIWIGANAEPSVRRAAHIGDGWMSTPALTVEDLRKLWRIYEDERKAAGLTEHHRRYCARECWVGPDEQTAWARAEATMMQKYRRYMSFGFANVEGGADAAAADFRGFAKDRFVIGDAEHVKDELTRYRDDLGVEEFRFRMQWPGIEQDEMLDAIRRLGKIAASL